LGFRRSICCGITQPVGSVNFSCLPMNDSVVEAVKGDFRRGMLGRVFRSDGHRGRGLGNGVVGQVVLLGGQAAGDSVLDEGRELGNDPGHQV